VEIDQQLQNFPFGPDMEMNTVVHFHELENPLLQRVALEVVHQRRVLAHVVEIGPSQVENASRSERGEMALDPPDGILGMLSA